MGSQVAQYDYLELRALYLIWCSRQQSITAWERYQALHGAA